MINKTHFPTLFITLGLWTGLVIQHLPIIDCLGLALGLICSLGLLKRFKFPLGKNIKFFFFTLITGFFIPSITPYSAPVSWQPVQLDYRLEHLRYANFAKSQNDFYATCKIIQAWNQWHEPMPSLAGQILHLPLFLPSHLAFVKASSYGKLKISETGRVKFKPIHTDSQPLRLWDHWKKHQLQASLYWQKSLLLSSQNGHNNSWGRSFILAMLGISPVNKQVDYTLRRFGLNHLTAISGLHFSLVAMVGAWIAFYQPIPMQAVSAGLLSTLFLCVNELNGSSSRAWLMSLIAIGCCLLTRHYRAIHALALTTLILLLLFPHWSISPSFILSVSCSAILIALSPMLTISFDKLSKKAQIFQLLSNGLALQSAMFCMSCLLQLYWFGSISWLSIPSNIFLGPLMCLFFSLSLIAALISLVNSCVASYLLTPLFYCSDAILVALSELTHSLDSRWSIEISPLYHDSLPAFNRGSFTYLTLYASGFFLS